MRSRWVLSCLVSGLLFFANGTVAKEGKFFSAQIDYLLSDIEAQGRTVADQVGTRFDLEDTLGVDTQEGVPSVDLWFHILRRNSVRVSYFTSHYEGSTTLSHSLLYGDQLYPGGTRLDSEFDFSLARLHYNFRFLNLKVVDLGVLVGVDLFEGTGRLKPRTAGLPDEESAFSAPFPVLGLNITAKVPRLGLFVYAEATGISLDIGDVDASVLDAQVRVTGYFTDGPLGLTVGYRYLDLDLNVEDEGEGEITQKGFYGGIAIRF